MKKSITLAFLFISLSFSYSFELNAKYNAIPVDLFNDMFNYTKENLDESVQDAYKQVAQEYGTTTYVIKKILKGDTFYCFRIFDKLGIKPDKDGNYKSYDFITCSEKVQELVDNYFKSSIIKKSIDDSLKGENFFADGDEENSNYDLLVDFRILTEILFKEEIKLNTTFNFLAKMEGLSSNNSSSNGNNNGANLNNSNGNNGNNSNGTNNGVNGGANGTNNGNNFGSGNLTGENLIQGLFNGIESGNSGYYDNQVFNGNNISEKANSLLSNIPIGQTCNTSNQTNNEISNQTNITTNTNTTISSGNNNQANNNQLDENMNTNYEEDYDNYLNPIQEGEIPITLDSIGNIMQAFSSGNNNGANNTNNNLNNNQNGNNSGGGSNNSCPDDSILSICFKLVPSGPRGSVGGTVKKRSIEEVIDKISDTLKYMRYSWIVVAGHGDEALDIDFKHVSLPDIFAFNIILTPKPVFNFKKDKEVIKQANAPDTELEDVPRKLAKFYSDLNIVDGFNSNADFKKYLITNIDKIKPYRRVSLNYPEKITNDSASGIFDEAEKYSTLLTNILNMLNAMEELTRNWIGSSIALEEKSTF